MNKRVQECVKRIYIEKDYEYFKSRCREIPSYLDELERQIRIHSRAITVVNEIDSPAIELWIQFDGYRLNDLSIEYRTVLRISKVSDLFVFQHEFCVENKDPQRLDPELDGFRGWPYHFSQYHLEENATTFLERFGLQKILLNELDEVIVGLEMPAKTIFGSQMTVENALFRDLYEIALL